MIRIDLQHGQLRINRIDLFRRSGDGCYMVVFCGGDPSYSSVDVPLSRDQARELAAQLLEVADGLGPGLMTRGRAFSYRLRR